MAVTQGVLTLNQYRDEKLAGRGPTFTTTKSVEIKMWGAGGGGSNAGNNRGGGGGYGTAIFTLDIGTVISVIVGQGGRYINGSGAARAYPQGGSAGPGTASSAGGGGGRSEILIGSDRLLVAGAGGGAGQTNTSNRGGAGGGTSGLAGQGAPGSGGGGTQSVGGAKGTPAADSNEDGASSYGGNARTTGGAGGGGDGYYGGGGAVGTDNGGGGSGYINTGYSGYVSSTLTAGNIEVPGNSGDSDRGTAGDGGGNSVGADGKVLIRVNGGSWTTYNYTGSTQTYTVT